LSALPSKSRAFLTSLRTAQIPTIS
jgi:hypothetical protein